MGSRLRANQAMAILAGSTSHFAGSNKYKSYITPERIPTPTSISPPLIAMILHMQVLLVYPDICDWFGGHDMRNLRVMGLQCVVVQASAYVFLERVNLEPISSTLK